MRVNECHARLLPVFAASRVRRQIASNFEFLSTTVSSLNFDFKAQVLERRAPMAYFQILLVDFVDI